MLYCKSLLSILAVASITSSCRLFRPVNPNPNTDVQPTDSAAAAQMAEPSALTADPGRLNDANIAAIVLASNNTDISYARLVPSRAERTDVKDFARRMLTDHASINGLITELTTQLDMTPEDNVMSLDLRDESAAKRDRMRELSGYAFDSLYIENEVSYHRKFLYAIDNVLEPRARNSQLKSLITNVRPAVAAHLAHAEQIRANVLTRK